MSKMERRGAVPLCVTCGRPAGPDPHRCPKCRLIHIRNVKRICGHAEAKRIFGAELNVTEKDVLEHGEEVMSTLIKAVGGKGKVCLNATRAGEAVDTERGE